MVDFTVRAQSRVRLENLGGVDCHVVCDNVRGSSPTVLVEVERSADGLHFLVSSCAGPQALSATGPTSLVLRDTSAGPPGARANLVVCIGGMDTSARVRVWADGRQAATWTVEPLDSPA